MPTEHTTKSIPLVDLGRQYRNAEPELRAAIFNVLDRGVFILGDEVRQFESEFAQFCGAQHAIGVGNGTDALTLTLLAFGVGPGDEVIVPVNTFIATAEAVMLVGGTPVFADVSPLTSNVTLETVSRVITPKTKGILAVHLYGQPVDIDPLLEMARARGLFVVEDAAQAHGAFYHGRPVGSLADAACFSFFPAKNLGAFGDAGMVVTSRDDIAQFVAKFRDHGRTEKYVHERVGTNSRLDELQAAVLRVKLRRLAAWIEDRRRVAKLYESVLDADLVTLPAEAPGILSSYHLYVIQTRERDMLRQALTAKGIATGIHYPVPLHRQPAFRGTGQSTGSFPVAEHLAENILSLPIFPELEDDEVRYIGAAVNAAASQEVAVQ